MDNDNRTLHVCPLDTTTTGKRKTSDMRARTLPSNASVKFQEKCCTYSEDGYTQLTTMTFCKTNNTLRVQKQKLQLLTTPQNITSYRILIIYYKVSLQKSGLKATNKKYLCSLLRRQAIITLRIGIFKVITRSAQEPQSNFAIKKM